MDTLLYLFWFLFLFTPETSRCNETSNTLIDKNEKLKKMHYVLSYYNSVIMLHGFSSHAV